MSQFTPQLKTAVIIATKDRCELLAKRALPSVLDQTCQPNFLIVCDDSSPDTRPRNATIVTSIEKRKIKTVYLENQRSSGASGCWNSAIDTLFSLIDDPHQVLVAFLDDDDTWHPTYLESCLIEVENNQLDMVATGIHRIEGPNEIPVVETSPLLLRAKDFLTGNPGIQGTNLFLRLSTFLQAGGFDEELQSTTDRDLCIRLADLGTVRYGRLEQALVYHYADSGRARLSTKGSQEKLNGLTAFWRKYSGRMSEDQRVAFSQRATTLFGWRTPASLANSDSTKPLPFSIQGKAPEHKAFTLHIGVISSDPWMLLPLLQSLSSLQQHVSIKRLSIFVLDNACPPTELEQVVILARHDDLNLTIISEDRQYQDAQAGVFGVGVAARPSGRVGIAMARTMLQRYLGFMLQQEPGSIGWILDDDMRVDDRSKKYLQWLPAFRSQNVDVLFGAYEGSSPNPPLNGLRVQLTDLCHNLHWLKNLPEAAILPDRSNENATQREKYPDYYYDLSRKHSGHLEMPHWLEPKYAHETVKEAHFRLITGATGILNGDPLTRAIVSTPPENPLNDAWDSVNRGGCTFILNPDALTKTPNSAVLIQGREARRSDMMWAIVNRYYRRMNIKAVGFPIHHIGRITDTPELNEDKVQGEIVGAAIYAGLTEFLKDHPDHELGFSAQDVQKIGLSVNEYMTQRLSLLELSFYRITGLYSSIRNISSKGELDVLLAHLESKFSMDAFQRIKSGVKTLSRLEIHDFLRSLRGAADVYASAHNLGLISKPLSNNDPIFLGKN